jgi:hypothetical protein
METFIELKPFVNNPEFPQQRLQTIKQLDYHKIDKPIVDLIRAISKLDYCFTLQSCFGHFIYEGQNDSRNTSLIPTSDILGEIEYRIAYIALCLDNNENGRILLKRLEKLPRIDKHNIQFGCAEWFWDQQVNSFVLQVEPERFKYEDIAKVEYNEAFHLEKMRNEFYIKLKKVFSSLAQIGHRPCTSKVE